MKKLLLIFSIFTITTLPAMAAQANASIPTQCEDKDKKELEKNGASETGIKDGTCIALECKCGYDLNDGKCDKWNDAPSDDVNEPQLPKNATS